MAGQYRWLHCATEAEIRAVITRGEDAVRATKPVSPSWRMTTPIELTDGSWAAPWPDYCEHYLGAEDQALLVPFASISALIPQPEPPVAP